MNLFYASTPYHLLLCHVLALSDCSNEQNVLLLGDNIATLTKSYALFQQLLPNVFCKVYRLETTHGLHNNLRLFLLKKKMLGKLTQLVTEEIPPIEKFYYSCDWKSDVTYISYLLQAAETKFCYFEDGVNTYTNYNIIPKNWLERVSEKIAYGKWRINTKENGHLNKGASIHALYPELLPAIFSNDVKYYINPDKLLLAMNAGGIKNLPDNLQRCLNCGINEIITLDEWLNDAYIAVVKQEIEQAQNKGWVVAVKKHPTAEYGNIIEKLDANGKLIDLPKEYPVEIYYLLFSNTLKCIVGSTSTTMLTAKWLLPETEISALYTDSSTAEISYAPQLFDMFRKIGVQVKKITE